MSTFSTKINRIPEYVLDPYLVYQTSGKSSLELPLIQVVTQGRLNVVICPILRATIKLNEVNLLSQSFLGKEIITG